MSVPRDEVARGRPLDGVRILTLEQMQSLPYATQLLGRLGADVVKVEPPGSGESGRATLPAMRDPAGRAVGNVFLRNNLGKRSVVVDLKQERGRQLRSGSRVPWLRLAAAPCERHLQESLASPAAQGRDVDVLLRYGRDRAGRR